MCSGGGGQKERMRMPGFEPGISQPQCEVLTTILHTPGEAGYRSQYLSHAKRALYHLSYIPIIPTIHPHAITNSHVHTTHHIAPYNTYATQRVTQIPPHTPTTSFTSTRAPQTTHDATARHQHILLHLWTHTTRLV